MTSRQDAILQASAAAIAENGVRGLRVSDVAQVAGVSSGLLYYHFKDRDGLLAAALTYINDQARACRQAASGPEVSRAHLIEHLLAEIQDSPEMVENSLVWNELRASAVYEEPIRAPLARTSQEWTRETASAIRATQEIGEVSKTVDADRVAVLLNTLTEGLASRWLSHELSASEARAHLRAGAELMLPAHEARSKRAAKAAK
ncbi:TetR/AcrR family transcriptional regulator [Mycobacteroides chelonae]|uniref:TetR/AcrR family transcriptional regulator n=1 Tax=Mycobacteroides chelonae TaxID=1774 RepID=UPI001C2CB204|nr:TetR/AcrR family transcriptional regulator [Mycobacteroides chelonae]MBV0920033.1 TetR/AcrR family transcriptional regulator [Mycobacteroides chelonae]